METMYSQCLTLETTTTKTVSTNKQDNLPSTIWKKKKTKQYSGALKLITE